MISPIAHRRRFSRSLVSLNLLAVGIAAATSLAVTACSSSGGRPSRRNGEDTPSPAPVLEGSATFFSGAIVVTADDGPPGRPGTAGAMGRGGAHAGGSGRRGEGMGRRGRREGGSSEEYGEGRGSGEGGPSGGMMGGAAMASPLRHLLQVTLRNTSNQPADITIDEVKSVLGNFAAQPEKLTLAPGQSATLEPMLSSFEETPDKLELSVTLHLGTNEETHLFVLYPKRQDAAPANASAASAKQQASN